jgi:hypothetical protein
VDFRKLLLYAASFARLPILRGFGLRPVADDPKAREKRGYAMNELVVTMVRSPGLSDAEIQRRIGQAFDVLWRLAEQRTTSRDTSLAAEARPVAGDAGDCQHQNQCDRFGELAQGDPEPSIGANG